MKIIKEIIPYIVIIVLVVLIRTYIVTPVTVDGNSMENTLHNNDILLLTKYNKNDIKRNDIVVIKKGGEYLIKRVIALPKEKVKCVSNVVYVNNEELDVDYGANPTDSFPEVTLGDNEYFVLGDNRGDSFDSRYFGPVKKEQILGITSFRIFPFNKIGTIK